MKLSFTLSALLAVAAFGARAQTPAVTFVDHDKVNASLANGGPLVTASNLTVQGAHRTAPGQVEVHDKETDVLYITDGEATIVTGGTMVGGKQTAPGQYRGTDIQGGDVKRVVKGDVVVVQAGTPHWFKDVSKSVSYLVVKVRK
jgi:mannose-6-phosphate isomerase-like protein (cupin superfamily)